MSNKVLYQKWRPQTFSEIVGQDHISKTLINSIQSSNTSHAYLFSGPRGVGKTTTARILAKALNCTSSPNCNMQGKGLREFCEICISMNSGSMIDLIEIDAASNRGIDDIRDIKEKAMFAPNIASRKVYIIDEAHGLTGPAQQAFLKLLEEPPENVVIILATTEVNSLPLTIISRCQRFDFRRINHKEISKHLSLISENEKIKIDDKAIDIISVNSSGSLRDAENLLQQISSLGSDYIKQDHIVSFLGTSSFSSSIEILKSILESEPDKVLRLIQNEVNSGVDPKMIKDSILKNLRGLIYTKNNLSNLLEDTEHAINAYAELSQKHSLKKLNSITSIILNSDVPSNEHPPINLEVTVINACLASAPPVQEKKEVASAPPVQEWKIVCSALRRERGNKYFIGGLLNSVIPEIKENQISLTFKSNTMKQNFLDEISSKNIRDKVQNTINNYYGKKLEIVIEDAVNGDKKEQNPLIKTPIVQHAISMGAKIKDK